MERTPSKAAASVGALVVYPVIAKFLIRLAAIPLSVPLIIALTTAQPTDANAQFFFGWDQPPRYRAVKKPPRLSRPSRSNRVARPARKDSTAQTEKAIPKTEGPLTLVVSLGKQRVQIFDRNGQVTSAPISSGARGHATPTGIFSVLDKRRIHFSNLYDSAPMPFMQRITWSGVALHAGHLPGYPASHGCIRMPYGFAQRLFGMTKVGARVIVTHGELEPEEFTHPNLFKPLPPGIPVDTADQGATVTTAALPASGMNARAGDSEVAMMLGVTPAVAEVGQNFPRTRAGFAAQREAEKRRLADALKTAEAARDDAKARLVEAAKAASEAKAATRAPASAFLQAREAHQKALRAVSDAEKKLATTIARLTSPRALAKADDAALQKAASTETALEDEVFRLIAEADARKSEIEPAQKRLDEARAVADAADAARRKVAEEVDAANDQIKTTKEQIDKARHVDRRITEPVSVFISRKTGKIYVRQHWEPLLELPVTIANPDEPIGTYVFTAVDWAKSETEMRWTVVALPEPKASPRKGKGSKNETAKAPSEPTAPLTAKSALDRITVPGEALDRIAELMKPGSSLIISDNGLSLETGKYTDFIVSAR
jgi:lipoprotein-anchoring transpeptidase ErfK/SrfK